MNDSRLDIYDYLYDIFYGVVTNNVYLINEPQELTESDVKDGFIVIQMGNMYDESEFDLQAYGWTRCYVYAYVPPRSRGRLDETKYKAFEDSIENAISHAMTMNNGEYGILSDSSLSADMGEVSSKDNMFFLYIKSFLVNIN